MSRTRPHASSRAHRLGWAACGALLLHAAVLTPWMPARHATRATQASHGPMSLRLMPRTTLASAPNARPAGTPNLSVAPVPQAPRKGFTEPVPEAAAPETPARLLSPGAFDPADYLPRSEVSSPPLPLDVIEVPPPPDSQGGVGEVHVVLRLFIDESGEVRHIEAVGDRAPEAFEDAARAAFRRARFAPADLQGQVVKSRITVQIDFEALDAAVQPRPQASGSPTVPSA